MAAPRTIWQVTDELVAEGYECPDCGEARMDWLLPSDNDELDIPDGWVECQSCGAQYDPATDCEGSKHG